MILNVKLAIILGFLCQTWREQSMALICLHIAQPIPFRASIFGAMSTLGNIYLNPAFESLIAKLCFHFYDKVRQVFDARHDAKTRLHFYHCF